MYRFGDHKRDRFDSYGRMSSGYHRDRDRDRDRSMHMNDKRRQAINSIPYENKVHISVQKIQNLCSVIITDIHQDHPVMDMVQEDMEVEAAVTLHLIFHQAILEVEVILEIVILVIGDQTKITDEIMIEDHLHQMLIPSAPSLLPFLNVLLSGCNFDRALCFT